MTNIENVQNVFFFRFGKAKFMSFIKDLKKKKKNC